MASDVAKLLTLNLPRYTNMFSDELNISSMVVSSGIATVTTASAHQLTPGQAISLLDLPVPLSIDTISRVGTVGTVVTNDDHDLTRGSQPSITIRGVADAVYNGSFTILDVPNRKTIKFSMPNSGATSSSGGFVDNAQRYDKSYNGLFVVSSVPNATSFVINSFPGADGSVSTGKVRARIRISASATAERAIDAYTRQEVEKAWCFAVLGAVAASKERITNTDFTAKIQRTQYYRQQLQENISILVIKNVKDEIAARRTRDDMQELMAWLLKSIAFYAFPTNLHTGQSNPLVLTGHDVFMYDSSVYVHAFDFECSTDIYAEDTVGEDVDVAFRNINLTQLPDVGGVDTADAYVNLDEEALP